MANSHTRLKCPKFTQADLSLAWCALSRFASEFEDSSSSLCAERGQAARKLANKIKPNEK